MMSTRKINLNDMFTYELPAVPNSIFDDKSCELRISTSKSILKRKHHMEVTNPSMGVRDAVVIDGRAIFWVLQRPSKGFTKDVVLNFVKYATNSCNGHM